MPFAARRKTTAPAGKLSIGALSRATGIPIETLRTWERRYAFPIPERKPSGHRVYPVSSVPRLRRIAEALGCGHRAAEVVAASDAELSELLRATTPSVPGLPLAERKRGTGPGDLLRAVATFDANKLTWQLLTDWAVLGPVEFLKGRLAPLIHAVGEAWEKGRLEVRHEHFISERIGDLLRTLRLQFEDRATGPLVVVASLPGESHGLGLQMAALLLAVAGCRILFLGTEVPVAQVAALAKDLNARAVAVSVSIATRGKTTTTHLNRLRALLPRRVRLLVGGEGAPRPRPGLEIMQDLGTLEAWGRYLATDNA
jgi:methanogenic corrinoid protein MtbC1